MPDYPKKQVKVDGRNVKLKNENTSTYEKIFGKTFKRIINENYKELNSLDELAFAVLLGELHSEAVSEANDEMEEYVEKHRKEFDEQQIKDTFWGYFEGTESEIKKKKQDLE